MELIDFFRLFSYVVFALALWRSAVLSSSLLVVGMMLLLLSFSLRMGWFLFSGYSLTVINTIPVFICWAALFIDLYVNYKGRNA